MSTDAADRQGTSQKQQETAKFPGYERGRLAARSACALAEGREGSFIGCNADRDAQRRTPLAADGLEFTGEHNRPRRVPRLLVGGCFRRDAGERNHAAFVYDEVTIDRHGGLVPNSSRRSLDVTYDIQNDAVLGPAFDYWQTKRGRRAMPGRQDIDPTEIPRLLPNLQITELADNGSRIRYRLAGTAIVDAYGAELRGKYIDEVFAAERLHSIEENYRVICREKRPLLVCNRYLSALDTELVCARLIMPLSDDDVTIHQFITAISFHYPGRAAQWFGEWLGKTGNFDLENSYSELVG
jgi:hypothetical protein